MMPMTSRIVAVSGTVAALAVITSVSSKPARAPFAALAKAGSACGASRMSAAAPVAEAPALALAVAGAALPTPA